MALQYKACNPRWHSVAMLVNIVPALVLFQPYCWSFPQPVLAIATRPAGRSIATRPKWHYSIEPYTALRCVGYTIVSYCPLYSLGQYTCSIIMVFYFKSWRHLANAIENYEIRLAPPSECEYSSI